MKKYEEIKLKEITLRRIPTTTYWVSNRGSVYRKKKPNSEFKKLKQTTNIHGYGCLCIYYPIDGKMVRKYWQVHRLVYTMYKGDIPNRLVINHKNLNKLDNFVDNLEVVTSKRNKDHYNTSIGFEPYYTTLTKNGKTTVCNTHREVQQLLGLKHRPEVITILNQKEYNGFIIEKIKI